VRAGDTSHRLAPSSRPLIPSCEPALTQPAASRYRRHLHLTGPGGRSVKFQVERDVLADAVAWTARALPARPAVPVLAGMHLAAGDDLTLSSFDYDVSAQATVPVITE